MEIVGEVHHVTFVRSIPACAGCGPAAVDRDAARLQAVIVVQRREDAAAVGQRAEGSLGSIQRRSRIVYVVGRVHCGNRLSGTIWSVGNRPSARVVQRRYC